MFLEVPGGSIEVDTEGAVGLLSGELEQSTSSTTAQKRLL
jgi:hypothetical protein